MNRSFRGGFTWAVAIAISLGLSGLAYAEDSQSRLYTFEECPVTGPVKSDDIRRLGTLGMALMSAIVSPLIDGIVDRGVEAIKEAAKDKNFRIPSPAPVMRQFYEIGEAGDTRLNPKVGCLVLVRGKLESGDFGPEKVDEKAPLLDRIKKKFRGPGASPRDQVTRVSASEPEPLDLYFEAVPVLSDNGKALGFRPQALYVGKFVSSDGFFGSNKRAYSITLTFADPFGSEAFASADFKFEGVARGESIEACKGVPAAQYCPAVELGGIRGWYATKPVSDDLLPLLKKRQTAALTLKTAITTWVEPPARPQVADDIVSKQLGLYCTEVEKSNKGKPSAHQQWDPRCPSLVDQTRREYLYALEREAARLEKATADKYWADKCKDAAGGQMQKTEREAAICLQSIVGQPEEAAKFLLTSTIIETRVGSKVAAFLAPIAEKSAPVLKDSLKNKLDPAERQKAKKAAEEKTASDTKAARDATRAATLADAEAQIAQINYDAAVTALAANPNNPTLRVTVIEKQMALLKAQTTANDAYRTAGLSIPYPNVD